MEILTLPVDSFVSFSCAEIPNEIPVGLREELYSDVFGGMVPTVEFSGRMFHIMGHTPGACYQDAMDMETGDVVILDITGISG